MRAALVTESFLPHVNGVSNSVRHVAEHLRRRGDEVLVVAPGPGPERHGDITVARTRSVALPGYRSFPVGVPGRRVERALREFAPDVVHLASPLVLGAAGLRAAERLGVPTVAVYQTDVAGFARQYGVSLDRGLDAWVARLHRRCDRTLVPSTAARAALAGLGVTDLHLWRRGVRLDLFDPARRDPDLARRWRRHPEEVLVGYVGRLAAEKQVHRLAEVADLPGVRLVVVGDGPARSRLERLLPEAVFTGMLGGDRLAAAFATLDVFVHCGAAETFCQTVQEAQASGVPVVAPDVGGPLDLVAHGRTGLLHDHADPHSLRRTVAALVGSPDLRRRIARTARSAVGGRSWAGVVDELVDVHYAAVLGQPGARAAA